MQRLPKSKTFLFLLGIEISLGTLVFSYVYAQEASFSIEENGYFGHPVYGKIIIKLFEPGTSCSATIDFGDNTQDTFECNFPDPSPEDFFICEHEFMHIYLGPASRYPGLMAGGAFGCRNLAAFGEPEFAICRPRVEFDCAPPQEGFVFLEPGEPPSPSPTHPIPTSPITATSLEEFLNRIVNVIFYILFTVSLIFLLFGGLLILSSTGNPGQIRRGQKTIIYALLGIASIALSRGILELFLIVFQIRR